MRSTKSPNVELLSERTSSILRKVKWKNRASFFRFSWEASVWSLPRTNNRTSRREEKHNWYEYDCWMYVEKHVQQT